MNEFESDVEAHLNLSFMNAALGCKKTIHYSRQVNCDACKGSGSSKGTSPSICSSCKGSGQVIVLKSFLFLIFLGYKNSEWVHIYENVF